MELRIGKVLQKATLFQGIKSEECENLIECLAPRIKHYQKNEILLLTGDCVDHIGIVLSGTACAYLEKANGSQTLIANLTSTNVFGEILVSTRTHKSPVTVRATSDVSAAFIEYQRIYSMCAIACTAHISFIQNLLKTIGDKYFYLFERIAILREKSLRARILEYLHTMSDKGKTRVVTLPFSKTMLADYLLVNRSALSKELRKMQNDGIITVNGRIIELTG